MKTLKIVTFKNSSGYFLEETVSGVWLFYNPELRLLDMDFSVYKIAKRQRIDLQEFGELKKTFIDI